MAYTGTSMYRMLFISVLLVAAVHLYAAVEVEDVELVDYRLKYKASPFETFECNATGLACKNCRDLVYCESDDRGGWIENKKYTCPDGQVCTDARCTKTPSAVCSPYDDLSFQCGSPGLFPDPGDCRRYHFCVPDVDTPEYLTTSPARCGGVDYGYNAKTTFCDKKLTKQECKGYPLPLCNKLGESAALSENRVIFYTCSRHPTYPDVLYPYQEACPHGKPWTTKGCTAP